MPASSYETELKALRTLHTRAKAFAEDPLGLNVADVAASSETLTDLCERAVGR